jgi:hypothetical protein
MAMKTPFLLLTMLFCLLAMPTTTRPQAEEARHSQLSNSPPG